MGRLTCAIVVATVSALVCGGRAAAADPAARQTGELSVWNAASLPHGDIVQMQCRGGAGYEFKNLGTRTAHEFSADRSAAPQNPEPPDKPAIARWLVTITIAGGIAGVRREVSINGDGRLVMAGGASSASAHCTVQLPASDVQHLEALIVRSHSETWQSHYVRKDNPGGCCDLMQHTLRVEQEDSRGQRSARETYWYDESAATVPPQISALFTAVYQAPHACAF